MNRTLFAIACGLFLASAPLSAQIKATATPVAMPQETVADAMRRTSADLKEVLTALTEQDQQVGKLAATTDRIPAKRFAEIRETIKAEIAEVEAGLNSVRNTEEKDWEARSTELEALRKRIQESMDARNKGLAEAYGKE